MPPQDNSERYYYTITLNPMSYISFKLVCGLRYKPVSNKNDYYQEQINLGSQLNGANAYQSQHVEDGKGKEKRETASSTSF